LWGRERGGREGDRGREREVHIERESVREGKREAERGGREGERV